MVAGRRGSSRVIAGIALCFYTYFVDGWLLLAGIGALLAAAPFVIEG